MRRSYCNRKGIFETYFQRLDVVMSVLSFFCGVVTADFGVLGGQYGTNTLGGAGASANQTSMIQLGVRA